MLASFGSSTLVAASLLIFMGTALMSAAGQTASSTSGMAEVGPVVHALCGKSVAMLGESPVHGFGKTLEFKVEVVRRLVDGCHYSALFIESGTYDYIHIEKELKSGHDVTDSMISAAIGGLWANKEVQSLIPFLTQKVQARRLILGGLDDQLGAGTYAQHGMAAAWCNTYRVRIDRDVLPFCKEIRFGNIPTMLPTDRQIKRRSSAAWMR